MRFKDIISESAVSELVKELPSLAKHDYTAIDRLLKKIAKKHKITDTALEKLFKSKFNKTPKHWVDGKLDEADSDNLDIAQEVKKFAAWASRRCHLKNPIKVELSYDTQEAQDNHHTGRHIEGDPTIWVYAKNRNLVDILRTTAHEIAHCRQSELGKIKPGDSYPGSPIELVADMVAGTLIKIWGEKHHYIFQ